MPSLAGAEIEEHRPAAQRAGLLIRPPVGRAAAVVAAIHRQPGGDAVHPVVDPFRIAVRASPAGDLAEQRAAVRAAARLLRVPAASLRRKMQADPDICIAMLASTLQHLRLLVDQIEQLKAQTGAQRVAEFLLSLAQAESGPARVELPYDKSLLAGRLGMKPESLSRAFLRLKASGVTVEQAHVAIAELGRLRDLTLQERTVTRQR